MAEDISIFAEIDESLRVEKLQQFWTKFGNLVILGCVAIVVFTIAWVLWKNHMHDVNSRETHLLIQAKNLKDAGKLNEAVTLFIGSKGALAKLQQAQLYYDLGESDKAAALYAEIAKDKHNDNTLKDFATLQTALLGRDESTAAHANKDPVFAGMIDEARAARLIKLGKNKEAEKLLTPVASDEKAPMSTHMRAMELMAIAGENQ
jgi:hypothetical protein